MTDTTEKVILSVEIDQSEAIKRSADLSKEIKSLTDANKQLAKSGKETSAEYQENARLAKSLVDEKRNLDRQIDLSIKAFNSETGSIKQLRAEVSILTDRYNSLSAEERDNTVTGQELQKTIKAKTDRLKELEGAVGDNRRNVGNYKDAVKDLVAELRIGGVNVGTISSGFKRFRDGLGDAGVQLNSFNGLIKASALGAFAIILGSVLALVTKFEPVMDKLRAVFAGASAALDVIVQRLINFGQGLTTFLSGDFSAGIDQMRNSFDGMANSIGNAAKEAYQLAEALDALDDRQRAQIVLNAQAEKQVSQLLLQARNRTLADKERVKLLEEASKIERENYEQNKRLSEEAFEIAIKQAQIKTQLSRQEVEELLTNTNRREELEKRIGTLTGEELTKLANMKAGLIKQEQDSVNLQEKINNRKDALNQEFVERENRRVAKQLELQKKLQEEQEKLLKAAKEDYEFYSNLSKELEAQRQEELLQSLVKEADIIAGVQQQANLERIANRKLTEEELAELALLSADQQIEYIKKVQEEAIRAEITKRQVALQSAEQLVNVLGQLGGALGENAEFGKALAIAQATIDTYAGATKAFAQGGPLGFITGAAVIAAGLANVAKIASTPIPAQTGGISAAAGGGSFMTKGPTMLLVGDNPGGVERIDVTPLSGRGRTRVAPGGNLVAMAGGGSLITSFGGFAERNSKANGAMDYERFLNELKKITIVTKLAEIKEGLKEDQLKTTISQV